MPPPGGMLGVCCPGCMKVNVPCYGVVVQVGAQCGRDAVLPARYKDAANQAYACCTKRTVTKQTHIQQACTELQAVNLASSMLALSHPSG